MTQPNNSILVAPAGGGANVPVPTHLVGTNEFQVVMIAGPGGNIQGTRETYIAYCPPVSAVGISKLHFDLFNATGSGRTMEILWISTFSDMDVAAVGAVATRIDLFRSSAVGTGGTAVAFEPTTAVRGISRVDTSDPVLPAGVTMREAPTGGATVGAFLGSSYTMPEEASTSQGYMTQLLNHVAYSSSPDSANLTVYENQGLRLQQGPVASVGKVGCRIAFTLS